MKFYIICISNEWNMYIGNGARVDRSVSERSRAPMRSNPHTLCP
jgi:hypothetical protein